MLPARAKTVLVGIDIGCSFIRSGSNQVAAPATLPAHGVRGGKKAGKCTQAGLPMQRQPPIARGLLIIEKMQSGHPLDPLIAAADRALRALFAPAHASRAFPVPQPRSHPIVGGPPAKTPSSPALTDSETAAVAA